MSVGCQHSRGVACTRSDAGFSLMEVIVALALLSLITGLLASSVKGTRNILAFVARNNAASASLPAQSYLRSAFAQAVPASAGATAADRTTGLEGDATRVAFKTAYAPKGQFEGLYHVEVRLEPGPGRSPGSDLVVIQTLLRPDGADPAPPSQRSTLASNVSAVTFSYFGVDTLPPNDWQWFDSWSSPDQLPRFVRLEVTFARGAAQSWRQLVFPLQLAQ